MTPQAQLERLLRSLFSPDELARFLRAHPDTVEIVELLAPGAAASMVADAVQALDRRGLIDAALFDRLCAERPRRDADIREVQAQFGDAATSDPTTSTKPPGGKKADASKEDASPLGRILKIGAGAVAGIPVLIKLGMEIVAALQGTPGGGPTDPVEPPPTLTDGKEDPPLPPVDPGGDKPPTEVPDPGPPGSNDGPSGPAGPKTCVSLEGGPELVLPARLPDVVARFSDGSAGPATDLLWTVEPSSLAKVDASAGTVLPDKLGAGTLRPAMGTCSGRVTVRTAEPHVEVRTTLPVNLSLTLPAHPVASANGLDATLNGVELRWSLNATSNCLLTGTSLKGLSEGTCELRVRTNDGQIDKTHSVTVYKLNLGNTSIRNEAIRDIQLAPRETVNWPPPHGP